MPWPPGEPPWTDAEMKGAFTRAAAARTPLPAVGERVLFRAREWEEPAPATVTSVQDMTVPLCANGTAEYAPDVHVWAHPDPQAYPPKTWTHPQVRARLRVKPDPWPRVRLELDGGGSAVCRESRVRGAPGWLRPGKAA